MDKVIPVTSRRALLGALVTTPTIAQVALAAAPHNAALAALWKAYDAEPVQLLRTRDGRNLSRERYRRAEEFMLSLQRGVAGDWPDFLYFSGIVAQLALSSHLLDVGFPDAWCARHIGLQVARSLAYANVSGFGLECAETQRLAQVLTPYWKWNQRSLLDGPRPSDGGFAPDEVRTLLRALIDQVRQVTGHSLSHRRMRGLAALQV